ncbi:T9SS type A sorting domain-containing protein [Seonamhaeicola marinus]|uniref:T9SS type A sorting domain-containing protein n=1 Tax=Seonamhaeicola marinus TaxID=1912246 RepID=A0A5D0HSR0_9FLAO|nr:T9SS type A sorting domain-containing protein [Seonamhaeicola marinus]TYA74010.1 T9SS type A sorting domain-containing protein [Seonamhaeicola marinus]
MKTLFLIFFLLATCHTAVSQSNDPNRDIETKSVFKCHPNPVENDLFIVGTHKIKSVEFIDVLGKRAAIYLFNKSIIKLDVSYLKSGIYLLQVIDENNKVETKKLVVK